MEDHFNTGFGAASTLDLVVRRCLDGFRFWQRIQGSSESAKDFQVQLDLQRLKLDMWAHGWGIESNNHRKDRLFCRYEPVVTRYLQLIHRIFTDFDSLDELLPMVNQTRAFVSSEGLPQFADSGSYPGLDDGRCPDSQPSYSRSIKWAFQEDRLKSGLSQLTQLIQDLYTILPPTHVDSARALILSRSLATENPDELARVSRVESNDPKFAATAWMSSVAHRPYGTHLGCSQLNKSHLLPINRKDDSTKYMARYHDKLVLVEEKQCTAPKDQLGQLDILRSRIDSIVVRLQNPSKPEELRTLPCWGGAFGKGKPTGQDETAWTYSIVYHAEYPSFVSLYDLIRQKKRSKDAVGPPTARLPLGARFIVARMLTRALTYLHLASWLHKAVRSENVVFWVDGGGQIQSGSPYLVGFEHSRPDLPGEHTENVAERPHHRFYRHPKALAVPVADPQQPLGGPGLYSKSYDIYSMGVVLLEIGLFATAEAVVERYLKVKGSPLEEVRRVLVNKVIPDLRFLMGESYASATLACLDGSMDEFTGQSLHEAFYKEVVCKLDICKA